MNSKKVYLFNVNESIILKIITGDGLKDTAIPAANIEDNAHSKKEQQHLSTFKVPNQLQT
jgi:hypothetical protein